MDRLRMLAPGDFMHAATTGRCPPFLWSLLRGWGQLQDADIQFLEGLNSKIKIHSNRSQRMRLPTMSNRMRSQQHLGSCGTPAGVRMALAREVVQRMEQGASSEEDIRLKSRWASPSPTPSRDLPTVQELRRTMSEVSPWTSIDADLIWATPYSMQCLPLRASPPAHPSTMPRRVALISEAGVVCIISEGRGSRRTPGCARTRIRLMMTLIFRTMTMLI